MTTEHTTVRQELPVMMPVADAWETEHEIQLQVEMPGVEDTGVDVTVERGVLTIEGTAAQGEVSGHDLVGREQPPARYRRVFEVSGDVDAGRIKARMRQGVLHLTLPKREETKARKVAITAG